MLHSEVEILVVEDEGLVACEVRNQLADMGFHQVVTVGSADAALRSLSQSVPDIALLDINLKGGVDGVELANKLKDFGEIPVIYMTAYADPETLRRAIDTVPQGYLVKPVATEDLQSTLESVLLRCKEIARERGVEEQDLASGILNAQKMDAIGKLAAGLSHELNNALLVISGNLSLLGSATPSGSSQERYVLSAKSASAHCTDLIQKLLRLAQCGTFAPHTHCAKSGLESALELVKPVLGRKIEVRTDTALQDCSAYFDDEQFLQVISNLVLNAQQAMPDGGCIEISIREAQAHEVSSRFAQGDSDNFIVIEVKDTGCGIPDELQPFVFDPFYSISQSEMGSGLGLSVVYSIMQRHGGWVVLDSKPQRGTRVSVGFRRKGPEDRKPQVRTESKPSRAKEGKVLILDDEDLVVDVTQEHLVQIGIDSIGFTSADRAFRWYESHYMEVGAIILDLRMPECSAEECFNHFRRINPDATIFLFSGYAPDQAIEYLLDRGAAGYFQKPVDFRELQAKVRAVCSSSESGTQCS